MLYPALDLSWGVGFVVILRSTIERLDCHVAWRKTGIVSAVSRKACSCCRVRLPSAFFLPFHAVSITLGILFETLRNQGHNRGAVALSSGSSEGALECPLVEAHIQEGRLT